MSYVSLRSSLKGNISQKVILTQTDEPEKYRDAPISLQLVGRRYDDEKIIQALEYMQKHIKIPV